MSKTSVLQAVFNKQPHTPPLSKQEIVDQAAAELTFLRPEFKRAHAAYMDYAGKDEKEHMELKIEMQDACRALVLAETALEEAMRATR